MDDRSQQSEGGAKLRFVQLDRTARELNAFLLVLAIGFVALDATFFVAFKVRDALPSPPRIEMSPSVAGKPAATPGPSLAALSPTNPGAAVNGR